MNNKILVTGASGVWAGVRKSSSRKYLQDDRIRFAELDFTDSDRLASQLLKHKEEHGGWDYIIHCAGVTKCLDKAGFEIGNYWATRHFIETLMKLDMAPKNFIFISSLSIFGQAQDRGISSGSEGFSIRDIPSYWSIWPSGEGLLPDGKVDMQSCGFRCGI